MDSGDAPRVSDAEEAEISQEISSQTAFRRVLGGQPGDGCAAHHIVPKMHRVAAPALGVLADRGISVNDPRNGALIDGEGHSHLHTNFEIDRVNESVVRAQWSRTAVLVVLQAFQIEYEANYPC